MGGYLLTIDEVKEICKNILKNTKNILELVKNATTGNKT